MLTHRKEAATIIVPQEVAVCSIYTLRLKYQLFDRDGEISKQSFCDLIAAWAFSLNGEMLGFNRSVKALTGFEALFDYTSKGNWLVGIKSDGVVGVAYHGTALCRECAEVLFVDLKDDRTFAIWDEKGIGFSLQQFDGDLHITPFVTEPVDKGLYPHELAETLDDLPAVLRTVLQQKLERKTPWQNVAAVGFWWRHEEIPTGQAARDLVTACLRGESLPENLARRYVRSLKPAHVDRIVSMWWTRWAYLNTNVELRQPNQNREQLIARLNSTADLEVGRDDLSSVSVILRALEAFTPRMQEVLQEVDDKAKNMIVHQKIYNLQLAIAHERDPHNWWTQPAKSNPRP